MNLVSLAYEFSITKTYFNFYTWNAISDDSWIFTTSWWFFPYCRRHNHIDVDAQSQ